MLFFFLFFLSFFFSFFQSVVSNEDLWILDFYELSSKWSQVRCVWMTDFSFERSLLENGRNQKKDDASHRASKPCSSPRRKEFS